MRARYAEQMDALYVRLKESVLARAKRESALPHLKGIVEDTRPPIGRHEVDSSQISCTAED